VSPNLQPHEPNRKPIPPQEHISLPEMSSMPHDTLENICNNSSISKLKKQTDPLTPLGQRFATLEDHLNNSSLPDLHLLDEYFAIGGLAFRQEAALEIAQFFERLSKGTAQEKRECCLAITEQFLKDAELYKKAGNKEFEDQSRIKANNWLIRANALCHEKHTSLPVQEQSPADLNDICNNSSIDSVERPNPHPDPYERASLIPLQKRYFTLEKYFETTTNPTLQKLDEYLTVSIDYYQQEAQKGGEDQKEALRTVSVLQKVANGSYQQEKWFFCLASQETALTFAERFEKEGKGELARRSRTEANNWQKLAQACQQQRPENNRRK